VKRRKKTATRKSRKSIFERRQDTAVKISKDHSPLCRDPSKKHIFLAKYIVIHLEIDTVVRVSMDIKFHDRCWYLSTVLAKQSEIDDREWIASLSDKLETDSQRVEVTKVNGG
jgi:hypothetical protein